MRRISALITPSLGVRPIRPSSLSHQQWIQTPTATTTATATSLRWFGDDSKDAGKKKSEPAKRQDKGIKAPPPLPSVMLKPKQARMPRGVGTLEAKAREDVGNHSNRATSLRDVNRVPAVIFNRDRPTDKLLISFDQDYLETAVGSEVHFGSRVFNLNVEGHPTYKVIPHQIQFHPTHRRIMNITFMVKSTTRPHPINIPIILVGHDQHPGVVAQMDIIQQHQYLLPAFWDHKADDIIPEALYLDVSKFLRGAVIRASDLLRGSFPQIPKAITLADKHKNHILFSVRRYVRDKG